MTTTPDTQPDPPFTAPSAPPPSPGERAAGEIAEFSRLFEERRAVEAAAPGAVERDQRNLRGMDALAPTVQRYLEFTGAHGSTGRWSTSARWR